MDYEDKDFFSHALCHDGIDSPPKSVQPNIQKRVQNQTPSDAGVLQKRHAVHMETGRGSGVTCMR